MTSRFHPPRKDSTRKYLKASKATSSQSNEAKRNVPIDRPKENSVDEIPALKKFVDRFRHDEAKDREHRQSVDADLWWLHDELQTTQLSAANQSNLKNSELIEIFPSTDIDDELNARASLILNRTFSAQSSFLPLVSSQGVGSTLTSTLQTTHSTLPSVTMEQPARPSFTRFDRTSFAVRSGNEEEDILYQWRLRRRMEQAQNNEHISLPPTSTSTAKINKTNSISTLTFPSKDPVDEVPIRNIRPFPPPPPVPASVPVSVLAPSTPRRTLVDMCTQTVQDVSIQTSLIIADGSTRLAEDDQRANGPSSVSVSGLPPRQTKMETNFTPIRRPVDADEDRRRSSRRPSSHDVRCSMDSSLTEVTSIQQFDHRNDDDDDDDDEEGEEGAKNPLFADDFSSDEILHLLQSKRDELFRQLQTIDDTLNKTWK